ncbi:MULTISPECIES: hypothetical protein [Stenotrophomonas]|uniref:hypothetical protein n=1 Tax=Stenotrophomonas TaxID=40323 RepID=UPI000AA7E7D0|nr:MULTISPECIES: hypothetical protein [Stenotrophomonas]
MMLKSSHRPSLRATFSRKREKGQVHDLLSGVRGLTDCSNARFRLSRKRERMPEGQVRALFAMTLKSSPHPSLRATFSRRREKGQVHDLLPGVRGLTDCSAACCRLSRKRERMPEGQVRALFAMTLKSSPHPSLRATFSRRREKGQVHDLLSGVRGLTDCSAACCRLSRRREKGQVHDLLSGVRVLTD